MHEVRLALSKKQHASLLKGRRVRIGHRHMDGTGAGYHVNPETFDRLRNAYASQKGVDIELSPAEIQASLTDGSLGAKIKQGKTLLSDIRPDYSSIASGQNIDYVAKAAAEAAIANGYNPYRVAPPPILSQIGIPTHVFEPHPTRGEGFRHIRHHLIGRGSVDAANKMFHRAHVALLSTPYSEGFCQQLPGAFKDAARLASGKGLYL